MYIARVLYICKIDRALYYINIYINNKVIYIYFNHKASVLPFLIPLVHSRDIRRPRPSSHCSV